MEQNYKFIENEKAVLIQKQRVSDLTQACCLSQNRSWFIYAHGVMDG